MNGINEANCFISISGNENYIHDNVGYRNDNKNIVAAFKVRKSVEKSGEGNKFMNNVLYMNRLYGEIDTEKRTKDLQLELDAVAVDKALLGDKVKKLENEKRAFFSDNMAFATKQGKFTKAAKDLGEQLAALTAAYKALQETIN